MRYLFILLAVVVGAFFPIQASINAKLGGFLKAPILAAFVNFVVGSIAMLLIVLSTRTNMNFSSAMKDAPAHTWIGGVIGACCVSSIIFLVPRLGAALSFALLVLGQMIFSIIIDHNGFFGVNVQPVNFVKIIGVFLILSGVVLISKF